MPVKSPTRKTAATAATSPRKRRTRKTTASTPKKVSINKSQSAKVIVTEEPKVEVKVDTKPTQIAPPKPNLSREDYIADIKARWAIHTYEVNALGADLVKGYNLVTPYLQKGVTYVKDSYKRAFA
jgi:hypothetical protein